MNLPIVAVSDGCILLLLIILVSPCHAWLLVSRESEHNAIRVGRVVVVRVAVVVHIPEVRRVGEIRAAQPEVRRRQPGVE